jgi:hemoglobin
MHRSSIRAAALSTCAKNPSAAPLLAPPTLLDFAILKKIKADLKEADVNNDGKIDFEELKLILQKYHHCFSDDQVQDISDLFEVGKSGKSVSHTTFLRGVQHVVAYGGGGGQHATTENPLQLQNLDDKSCWITKKGGSNNAHFHDIQRKFDENLLAYVQQINLLQELGGTEALKVAVDKFYDAAMQDERILPFFQKANVDVQRLKNHQHNFMRIAFSKKIPSSIITTGDDALFVKKVQHAHKHLMEQYGLNETHFDIMMEHFCDTLKELSVPQSTIDTSVEVLWMFRVCFIHDE